MTIPNALRGIATRISRMQGPFAATPSHVDAPFPRLRFTFDELQLEQALSETDVVGAVHHGALPARFSSRALSVLREQVAALTHVDRGRLDLTYGQLRSILCGEIRTWAELKLPGSTIDLLVHCDPLHFEALRFLMGIGCGELATSARGLPTYDALAAAAAASKDCLAFGLRPSKAGRYLRFVDVNGVAMWDLEHSGSIPSQNISLVLPSRQLDSAALRSLEAYLEAVEYRASQDCLHLSLRRQRFTEASGVRAA